MGTQSTWGFSEQPLETTEANQTSAEEVN